MADDAPELPGIPTRPPTFASELGELIGKYGKDERNLMSMSMELAYATHTVLINYAASKARAAAPAPLRMAGKVPWQGPDLY